MAFTAEAQQCRATYKVSGMVTPTILAIRFRLWLIFVAGIQVRASLVDAGIADNRKQILASIFGVFVEYLLHLLSPFDD